MKPVDKPLERRGVSIRWILVLATTRNLKVFGLLGACCRQGCTQFFRFDFSRSNGGFPVSHINYQYINNKLLRIKRD